MVLAAIEANPGITIAKMAAQPGWPKDRSGPGRAGRRTSGVV